jgi:hypothetical protein
MVELAAINAVLKIEIVLKHFAIDGGPLQKNAATL